jgi:hypothetical protein
VEFDFKLCKESFDRQASLIRHLATIKKLVLVVYSGNKSLHSWFSWENESEETALEFMREAVLLGADHSLLDISH